MNPLFPDQHSCALVGMVHLKPLPGSSGWGGSMSSVLDAALADAEALMLGGCDALLVENMGDVPYLKGEVAPETVAAMAIATASVVSSVFRPASRYWPAQIGRPSGLPSPPVLSSFAPRPLPTATLLMRDGSKRPQASSYALARPWKPPWRSGQTCRRNTPPMPPRPIFPWPPSARVMRSVAQMHW